MTPLSRTLEVPGASLHVERRGSGPALLLIPGGNGDAGPFEGLAHALSDRYQVLSYDRRGFSRSPLQAGLQAEALQPQARLAANVDDALHILEEFGASPAHVFGSSSGAIIALHLLLRHPERVRTLIAHEPPLVELLPDAERQRACLAAVHELYRQSGVAAAMQRFAVELRFPERPRSAPEMRPLLDRTRQNQAFFFEHELRQYPLLTPDLEALALLRSQLVLGVGRDTSGTFAHRPNLELAARLGLEVAEFAGGHFGYATHPSEFAQHLAQAAR